MSGVQIVRDVGKRRRGGGVDGRRSGGTRERRGVGVRHAAGAAADDGHRQFFAAGVNERRDVVGGRAGTEPNGDRLRPGVHGHTGAVENVCLDERHREAVAGRSAAVVGDGQLGVDVGRVGRALGVAGGPGGDRQVAEIHRPRRPVGQIQHEVIAVGETDPGPAAERREGRGRVDGFAHLQTGVSIRRDVDAVQPQVRQRLGGPQLFETEVSGRCTGGVGQRQPAGVGADPDVDLGVVDPGNKVIDGFGPFDFDDRRSTGPVGDPEGTALNANAVVQVSQIGAAVQKAAAPDAERPIDAEGVVGVIEAFGPDAVRRRQRQRPDRVSAFGHRGPRRRGDGFGVRGFGGPRPKGGRVRQTAGGQFDADDVNRQFGQRRRLRA